LCEKCHFSVLKPVHMCVCVLYKTVKSCKKCLFHFYAWPSTVQKYICI